MTLWRRAYLTWYRNRQLMIMIYFKDMSCHTLSLWVRWPSIWVSVPLILNMSPLVRFHIIPPTPPPEFRRSSHMKLKGTSNLPVKPDRETHTTRLWLRKCLIDDIDVVYFISETIVYFIVLHFILFILN
jgi:hypothetical protein